MNDPEINKILSNPLMPADAKKLIRWQVETLRKLVERVERLERA